MKVNICSHRKLLKSCHLDMYNYQIDPYIGCEHCCQYCYALNEAETDWEKEILIYRDITKQLVQELSSIEPLTKPIYFGMESDPYQPLESELTQTRKALELLAEKGYYVSILTKSGLIIRDIDLLTKMQGSSAGFSIAFQDEETRKLFEKNAPSNEERIESLKKLKESGIETYTLICPVMPFITDIENVIELVVPFSDTIWIYKLHMESEKDKNWLNIKSILDQHFPRLTEQYREIAFSSNHHYWKGIRHRLEEIQIRKRLNLRIEI